MKKNMCAKDRLIRLGIVIVLAALVTSGNVTGTAATVVGLLAIVVLLTIVFSFCPLYKALGITTVKDDK